MLIITNGVNSNQESNIDIESKEELKFVAFPESPTNLQLPSAAHLAGQPGKISVVLKNQNLLCVCSGHLVVQDTLFKSKAEILWNQRFICSMNECYKRPVFISRPVDATHLGKNRVHGSCDVLKFSVLVMEEVQDDNIIGDLSESRRERKGNSGKRMLLASPTL